jgi:hypothetical protein
MYVTFLYELDRSSWSKFHRSFDDYLKKFEALLQSLKTQITVFGDDSRVREICFKYGQCTFYSKPLKSWNVYTTLARITTNLDKKRGRFRVPEFFSEEYICLQLVKFEAVQMVCRENVERENEIIIWIDAGLHSHLMPKSWKIYWSMPDKIHALQIGPMPWSERWVLETPSVCIAGTCWGGSQKAMQVLSTKVLHLHEETLQKGLVGNDQQYLSIIFKRHTSEFLVKRSFTDYGIYSSQNFNQVVDSILNESFPEQYASNYLLFFFLLGLASISSFAFLRNFSYSSSSSST